MLKRFTSVLIAISTTLLFTETVTAQSIRDEVIEYTNVKPPSNPLPKEIKNYQVEFVAPYKEKNKSLRAEYDKAVAEEKLRYEQALIDYKKDLKIADEEYEEAMEAYKKKSLGEKIVEKTILNENTKPVKRSVYPPYLKTIPKPYLQSEYDGNLLAATYINLDGMEKASTNSLKITITLFGYDFTQPRNISTQKDMIRVAGGNTSTYKQAYYYTEYSYRHPMAVKVNLPDGKEILNITPQPLNLYKIYHTGESTASPSINGELLVLGTEEKTLQENLQYINKLINEKYAFYLEKRKATLYYAKDRKGEYSDLTQAFNEASSALVSLYSNNENSIKTLQHSMELWRKAFGEYESDPKDGRIDKDAAIALALNMLEVSYALKDISAGEATLQKLNTLSLSNSERAIKTRFENELADLKKRLSLNQ